MEYLRRENSAKGDVISNLLNNNKVLPNSEKNLVTSTDQILKIPNVL